MNDTIKLILSLSLSGSILAVLIFAIKPLIKHKLSKTIQYYIWLVVLLRLMLPFSFEGSIINGLFYGGPTSKLTAVASSQDTVQPAEGTTENTNSSFALPSVQKNVADGVYNGDTDHSRYFRDLFNQYLLAIWLLGVLIALAVNLTGYTRFLIYLKRANKPATAEENKMLTDLSAGRCKVRLVRNRLVSTPILIGMLRPLIIIPELNFNEKQLKNILLHELTHLKRWDIAVKWLTMLAVSLHWFNPLVYFIKKEINRACELSCDEAVIKNFNSTEKQAYGDTLITVVAEAKYPVGVLQATMSEEKSALKERLLAIMKHNKKPKVSIILSGLLLLSVIFGAIGLGAGVGLGKDAPPKIYISAEDETTKAALTGGYTWNYMGKVTLADSADPINFNYQADNIISVTASQQLIIATQKRNIDKKYEFSLNRLSVYKAGKLIQVKTAAPSFLNGNLYLQAPAEAGEYIYKLDLNYQDQGTAEYGFVVRVDMLAYDLTDIAKSKTPYLGDASKVSAIAGRLPLLDKYFKQQYISMETAAKPYSLTVYYEAVYDTQYHSKWPIDKTNAVFEANMSKNALVLFCMIDNLDEVTFAFRNSQSDGQLETSQYDSTFTYQRSSFEAKYGDLAALGGDIELLNHTLTAS